MMPLSGIATFAGAPAVSPSALAAARPHFAVFGVPFDCGVGYRPGQRLAPRAIRDASTRYRLPWGDDNPGYWDVEDGRRYLAGCRLVDAGDVDPLYFDLAALDARTEALVGAILDAGAVPIGLGGDHSVTYPILRAFGRLGAPLDVLQIDAHLDFSAAVDGFPRSNSSPLRRAAELGWLGGVCVVGVRGIRTSPEAYAAAQARGHRIVLARDGLEAALAALPAGRPLYVTVDVDGLDPAVAPGTSSPEPGGLSWREVRALLAAALARNRLVGADVVEVNPYLDPTGVTALLAARLAVELMALAGGG
jgi:agmatinase